MCRNPAFLWVGVSNSLATKLPSGFGSIVSRRLLSQFREKKFDQGLKEAIEEVLVSTGVEDKGEEVTGLVLSDDLIFVSRIGATAKAAGLAVRQARTARN